MSSAGSTEPGQAETFSLSELSEATSREALVEQALRGGYDYTLGFTDPISATYEVNLVGEDGAAETPDYIITASRGELTGVWEDITGRWSLADVVIPDDGSTRFGMQIDDSELVFNAIWEQGRPNNE